MAKKVQTRTKQVEVKKEQAAAAMGQVLRGRVVTANQPQTVTVLVENRKTHPLYGKSFRRSKRYLVQDDIKVAVGDVVEISHGRPVSKNKNFRIVRVVGKDVAAVVREELKEDAAEAIAEVMPEEKAEVGKEEKEETAKSEKATIKSREKEER